MGVNVNVSTKVSVGILLLFLKVVILFTSVSPWSDSSVVNSSSNMPLKPEKRMTPSRFVQAVVRWYFQWDVSKLFFVLRAISD